MIEPITDISRQQLFLQKLRTATAPMHKSLEQSPLSAILMSDDLTAEAYVNYLVHMGEVIKWAEQHIWPVIGTVYEDADQRIKYSFIENDLEVMGIHTPVPAPGRPFAGSIKVTDLAAALGYMYVIEGSMLGGQVLLRQVKKKLGFDENHGASFFGGYGADTGKYWKRFLDKFCDYIVNSNCETAAINGSVKAFEDIRLYFGESSVCR